MAKTNNFVTGLVAGAVVGAIAGVVLAPKAGKDTREIVGSRTNEIRNRAEFYIDGIRERFRRDKEDETVEAHSENGV